MADDDVRLQVNVSAAVLEFKKKHLKATLRRAGNEVAGRTRALLRGAGGGRLYRGTGGGSSAAFRGGYRKGAFRASLPGSAPAKVTGTLARNVRVRPFRSGQGVAVVEAAFYALFLANGAKGGGKAGKSRTLAPRPSITTALSDVQGTLPARIRHAVENDIQLVRTRR